MAELLLGAAAASAGGAAAAGAGAVTAGAAGAAATTGLSSTVLSILSGIATATGVLGTLASARSESQLLQAQASETELQAGQERLGFAHRQILRQKALSGILGENRVAAAAAGIDLQGGIVADQERKVKQDALDDLTIDREDDQMRRAMLKARAANLRSRSREAGQAGLLKAFGQVADLGLNLAQP